MLDFLNAFDALVWGPPLMILLIGTGIMLTIRLGLLQVMKLPKALQLIFSARSNGSGDVSSFQALCTALAATVGTGNICRCCDGSKSRRSRCLVLDVDCSLLWHGNQICGRCVGRKIS